MFKLKRIVVLSIIALVSAVSLVSCKDDEETTSGYLDSYPNFELPSYTRPNEKYTLQSSTVKDTLGNVADFYWYLSTDTSDKDTVKVYNIQIPDSLFTLSVTCVAFAEGYYTATTTKSVTIVSDARENGSITGRRTLSKDSGDFIFEDKRDGYKYYCTTIGDTQWIIDNLGYEGKGVALDGCDITSKIFGKFYSWEEAQTVCPEGWTLSSLEDWQKAAATIDASCTDKYSNYYGVAGAFMGDLYFNGEKFWEYWPNVKINNKLRLETIPMGYALLGEEAYTEYKGLKDYAVFWTSDSFDEEMAYYRYIYVEKPDVLVGTADKTTFGASVRCVRPVQD